MLIVRKPEGLLLIDQMEHGRLVGVFAAHWGNDQFPSVTPREPVVLAAALHDQGWEEPDARPLHNAEASRPAHFTEVPNEQHIDLYRPGVEAVTRIDPYAGILVGMHWIGLYRRRWGSNGPWDRTAAHAPERDRRIDAAVLEEERRWAALKQDLWPKAGRRSRFEEGLWTNYELLQVWDVLSLSCCMMPLDVVSSATAPPVDAISTLGSLQHEARERLVGRVPGSEDAVHPSVRSAPDDRRVDLRVRVVAPKVVAVDPYPFDAPLASLRITGRMIPDRAYPTESETQEAVRHARPWSVEFAIGASPPALPRR